MRTHALPAAVALSAVCALGAPAVCALGAPAAAQAKLLTLEQVAGRAPAPSLAPDVEPWRWAPDGEHLIRGRGDGERWIDPATGAEVAQPADAVDGERAERGATEHAALRTAFAALEGVDERTAALLAGRRASTSEDGRVTVAAHEGALFVHDERGARRLDVGGDAELADVAPDGSAVAYVRANDLYVADLASGRVRAITSGGDAWTLHGKLDWVYQEEIYGRGDFKGFWWSPTSRYVAYLRLDAREVFDFTLVDHVEDGHFRGRVETTRYPKPGDPNPSVRLGVADVATGATTWVDLARYAGHEPLVVRVGWTPAGDGLVFMVQDRIQRWLDLAVADPETGKSETWIHEGSHTWVERARPPLWLADGTFLWQSDRTGHRHVYRYRPGGELAGAVTSGPWSVTSIEELDEERGLLWLTANKDGAVDRNVYRIGLDGTGFVRLTSGRGRHTIEFDADRSYFLDRWSSLADPGGVRLCTGDGAIVRELATARVPAAQDYALSTWELLEVEARDGFALDVALLRPVPFDEGASHPVWMPVYAGPGSQSVRNSWSSDDYAQFLAQQGVVVMRVNVRSASGKGFWATEQCYGRLGEQELLDLEDALAWLTAHPWADAQRVGIAGHSYGGFMAAYALTHSDRFALGVAGSGVFDWRMYDTIYTERFMSTPQRNPAGYERSSAIAAAAKLHGHLVITHGTLDDNVHLQNAMALVHALQTADRDFELMLYPDNRHGIRDRAQSWHRQRLEWRAIEEHLRPPGPTRRAPALEAAAPPAAVR